MDLRDDGVSATVERASEAGRYTEFALATEARVTALPPSLVSTYPLSEHLFKLVLDGLPYCIFLVDTGLRMLHSNAAGRRLLHHRDSLCLHNGFVKPVDSTDATRLARLIRTCAEPHPARREGSNQRLGMSLRRSSGRPLLLVGTRLHSCITSDGAVVVLYLSDPDCEPGNCQVLLKELFELTEAEARLSLALIKGHGLASAASEAGMSVGTAHTHLRNIFGKTHTSRQAELVRLILTTPLVAQDHAETRE